MLMYDVQIRTNCSVIGALFSLLKPLPMLDVLLCEPITSRYVIDCGSSSLHS